MLETTVRVGKGETLQLVRARMTAVAPMLRLCPAQIRTVCVTAERWTAGPFVLAKLPIRRVVLSRCSNQRAF